MTRVMVDDQVANKLIILKVHFSLTKKKVHFSNVVIHIEWMIKRMAKGYCYLFKVGSIGECAQLVNKLCIQFDLDFSFAYQQNVLPNTLI